VPINGKASGPGGRDLTVTNQLMSAIKMKVTIKTWINDMSIEVDSCEYNWYIKAIYNYKVITIILIAIYLSIRKTSYTLFFGIY
jgi:hypothetical protein